MRTGLDDQPAFVAGAAVAGLGSRTSKISPSPLERPEEMHCSANSLSVV